MKILMVNDDGVESQGILLLAELLTKKGHTVVVCAPNINQSAKSHSITLRKPYAVENRKDLCSCKECYSIDGTPVDCVQFGLNGIDFQPDFLISGINNGMNIGTDTLYSGTVGGAMEGSFMGVPSIAVSVFYRERGRSCDFSISANYIAENIERLYRMTPKDTTLNINIPLEKIMGEKICPLAKCEYDMSVEKQENGYRLKGLPINFEKAKKGTDLYEASQGYVTITPLRYDLTDERVLKSLLSEKE